MLSARAYSFRQKSQLAISLSWIGGYTNVIMFLALGTLVSNVTGTATYFAHSIAVSNFHRAAFFGFLLCTFTAGAALSGCMTESARRRGWRSKYMLPISLEALLLALLSIHLKYRVTIPSGLTLYEAAGLASLAMGLQNATITRISGAVVRTTHLTGICTDFGLEGVQFLFWWGDGLAKMRRERAGRMLKISRRHPSALRLLLLMCIAVSFSFGAVAGTVLYTHWAQISLLIPVAFLMWIVWGDWRKPIADIRELDLLNDPELRLQGIISKLLPPDVVLYRASCRRDGAPHRAPDFQVWLDRVADNVQVVVLAVSPLTKFDANAVLDLEAAVNRLHGAGKKLVLSGITTHQFKALDALGVARMMDINNLCPDLEFAIARAMAVLEQMVRRRRRSPIRLSA